MGAKVLFVSFESLPFIKTGGLADVVYALPKALDKRKYEVRVCMPLFKAIKGRYYDDLTYLDHIYVHSGFINEEANIYSYINEGIEYLFIENDTFFNRDGVYGYDDDATRFVFFNVAVLEMMIKLDYYPDICHEHDYHTGILPALCKIRYNAIEQIRRIKHIFTIHNMAYQGIYDKKILFDLCAFDYRYYADGSLRFNDCCNFMKIALVYADIITTVSRTYAREIQSPQCGEGLEMVLRYRQDDLYGIVNGIDTDSFNPSTDQIAKPYTSRSVKQRKVLNKHALMQEFGFDVNDDILLVGMISRLTWQKGLDLLVNALPGMLHRDVAVIILGSGESKYEYALKMIVDRMPKKASFYCGYNEALAHRMYAGLDLLFMPSLFEPCGISQLVAMRYGTLPLVRETGGLKDTVEPLNEYAKTGRGFSFSDFEQSSFDRVFDYAYETYYDHHDLWDLMIQNAMHYDVSFKRSAREYEDLYQKLLNK